MATNDEIVKQKQFIVRCEKSLALEKLKKRRADTRRKIELGGLVIKAGIDGFSKSIILGGLTHVLQLIHQDNQYTTLFESTGNNLFLDD
jgi:hypothetical protein